ncbi:hypothetical protein QJS66_20920 [Kocuria rhizophila]|nr:hypothetical protein QJS66_20920 [Kocuria rhizophila]
MQGPGEHPACPCAREPHRSTRTRGRTLSSDFNQVDNVCIDLTEAQLLGRRSC